MADLEVLVRLMQMQMYTNTFDNRRNQDSVIGGSSSNFAVILSALLTADKGNSGAVYKGIAPTAAKAPDIFRAVAPRIKQGTAAAGSEKVSSPAGLEKLLERTATKFGIEPGLLKAVVKVESDFDPLAVSSAGAMGLMQLMPGTATAMGVKNPFNAVENLEGGARYLRSLLDRYKGDAKLALAAYNAGPGAVERHGGVPPYNETVSYLKKIDGIFNIF